MKLLTTTGLKILPNATFTVQNIPSGILNSKYKVVVAQNFRTLKKSSLFSIKQRLKSRSYNTNCTV